MLRQVDGVAAGNACSVLKLRRVAASRYQKHPTVGPASDDVATDRQDLLDGSDHALLREVDHAQ